MNANGKWMTYWILIATLLATCPATAEICVDSRLPDPGRALDTRPGELPLTGTDLGLREGWPVDLSCPGAGLPYTPTIIDSDGDGSAEIFLTGLHTFALDGFGNFLPGWPTSEQAYLGYGTNGSMPGPSVADVDLDGDMEVMWSTRDWWAGSAAIWCFNGRELNGANMQGYPLFAPDDYSNALDSPFVLADTDGDLDLEAWCAHTYGNTGIYYRISVLDHLGNILNTTDLNPAENIENLYYGDLDGDGSREIFSVTWLSPNYRLYAFHGDGSVQSGYPITLYTLPSGYLALGPPVPYDHDGDGDLEILIGYNLSGGNATANCLHHDGSTVEGFPFPISSNSQILYLGLGDIDGDEETEILAMVNYLSGNYLIQVHEPDGTILWNYPLMNWPKSYPTVADLDSDQVQDISFVTDGGMAYALHGPTGTLMADFPKSMAAPSVSGTAVGDIDGDGYYEMVAATWDGWVYAWDLNADAGSSRADWPMRGINPLNWGVFGEEWIPSSAEEWQIEDPALRLALNPAKGRVEFLLDAYAGSIWLDIYDVGGRKLESILMNGSDRLVWSPGTHHGSGVYLARLRGQSSSRAVKFLYLR